jgi:hypothetical protein
MADDDLPTRVTLMERTMVSREHLVEREERLLGRVEELLKRLNAQAADDQKHTLKVFGHEIAEQFRTWSDKIHQERDALQERRDAEHIKEQEAKAPVVSPIKGWFYKNWIWVGGTAALVIILRPDLATAVIRAVM